MNILPGQYHITTESADEAGFVSLKVCAVLSASFIYDYHITKNSIRVGN
jgi:hypothetical protein